MNWAESEGLFRVRQVAVHRVLAFLSPAQERERERVTPTKLEQFSFPPGPQSVVQYPVAMSPAQKVAGGAKTVAPAAVPCQCEWGARKTELASQDGAGRGRGDTLG